MTIELNETHDPARRSWVESANAADTDFPIQNLPFGLFRAKGSTRGGVALGDQIIDLAALAKTGTLSGEAFDAANAASGDTLLPLLGLPESSVSALRASPTCSAKTAAAIESLSCGRLCQWPRPNC